MPVRGFRPPNRRYESVPIAQWVDENNNNGKDSPRLANRTKKDKELPQKVGEARNVPRLPTRLPLWRTLNAGETKSCIDNPDEPLFSSFSKTGTFSPAEEDYLVVRRRLQQQTYAEQRRQSLLSARDHRSSAEDTREFHQRHENMLRQHQQTRARDQRTVERIVHEHDQLIADAAAAAEHNSNLLEKAAAGFAAVDGGQQSIGNNNNSSRPTSARLVPRSTISVGAAHLKNQHQGQQQHHRPTPPPAATSNSRPQSAVTSARTMFSEVAAARNAEMSLEERAAAVQNTQQQAQQRRGADVDDDRFDSDNDGGEDDIEIAFAVGRKSKKQQRKADETSSSHNAIPASPPSKRARPMTAPPERYARPMLSSQSTASSTSINNKVESAADVASRIAALREAQGSNNSNHLMVDTSALLRKDMMDLLHKNNNSADSVAALRRRVVFAMHNNTGNNSHQSSPRSTLFMMQQQQQQSGKPRRSPHSTSAQESQAGTSLTRHPLTGAGQHDVVDNEEHHEAPRFLNREASTSSSTGGGSFFVTQTDGSFFGASAVGADVGDIEAGDEAAAAAAAVAARLQRATTAPSGAMNRSTSRYPSGSDAPTTRDLLALIAQCNAEREAAADGAACSSSRPTSARVYSCAPRTQHHSHHLRSVSIRDEDSEERRSNSAAAAITTATTTSTVNHIEEYEQRSSTVTVPFVRSGAVDALQEWLRLSPRGNTVAGAGGNSALRLRRRF